MSTCAPLDAATKLDHPLASPSLLAEPPAPRTAATCTTSAATDPARHDATKKGRAPTVEELVSPSAPDLAAADRPLLLTGINGYLDAVFKQLFEQLPKTIARLALPAPAKDPSFASALLDFLVETLTTLVLGRISSSFLKSAKESFGELAAEPMKSVIKTGGKVVAGGIRSLGAGVPRDRTAKAMEDDGWADPTARTLLDEYAARQFNRLTLAQADARMTLGLMAAQLPRVPDADLRSLLERLRDAGDGDGKMVTTTFTNQLTIGWMNLTAAISLGPKEHPEDTDMPGANQVGGIRSAGQAGVTKWLGEHEGFMEIRVKLPEAISGTSGLALGGVQVAEAPGAALVLSRMPGSLMGLPVYRRVTLVQPGQGALLRAHALVITPEGAIEADASNEQLAAIGKGVEVAALDTWTAMSAGPMTSRPDPKDDATRAMRAAYAIQGGLMVAMWLGQFPAAVVR
jgi:hypothetical protein